MKIKRSKEKELLDLGSEYYSEEEYTHCLKILFKINKLLGFFKHTVKIFQQFPKNSTVVDIGCGGGLFLLHLSKYYPDVKLVGIDISQEAINLAQKELELWRQHQTHINIEFQLQKQTELQLLPHSVDVLLMTLVCHHIDDDELITFLKKANQVACNALIINELQRNKLAYWGYKILSPILFRNRLITHDGLISIQKSFTRRELHYLMKQANIKNYRIKWHFPFWWNILILKE